jgi:hypothetical protein
MIEWNAPLERLLPERAAKHARACSQNNHARACSQNNPARAFAVAARRGRARAAGVVCARKNANPWVQMHRRARDHNILCGGKGRRRTPPRNSRGSNGNFGRQGDTIFSTNKSDNSIARRPQVPRPRGGTPPPLFCKTIPLRAGAWTRGTPPPQFFTNEYACAAAARFNRNSPCELAATAYPYPESGRACLSPFRAKLPSAPAPAPGDLATPMNRNMFRGGGPENPAERAGA